MRQELLQWPYSQTQSNKTRLPLLTHRVFFLPARYFGKWPKLSWGDQELFGNDHPVHIEYCSGNGEWIIDKAERFPKLNWVAVEKKFKRVRKIYAKREKKQLKNLLIIAGDAITLTNHCVALDSIATAYVNFPDPWPKKRHAKHRLIQEPFAYQLSQIIAPSGELVLVTDHESYFQQMKLEVEKVSTWKVASLSAEFEEHYGSSYFDRLWRSKGLLIRFLSFKNKKSC